MPYRPTLKKITEWAIVSRDDSLSHGELMNADHFEGALNIIRASQRLQHAAESFLNDSHSEDAKSCLATSIDQFNLVLNGKNPFDVSHAYGTPDHA